MTARAGGAGRSAAASRVLDWWAEDPSGRAQELFATAYGGPQPQEALPRLPVSEIAAIVLDLAGERPASRWGFNLLGDPDGAAVRVTLLAALRWERETWAARLGGDTSWVVLLPAGEEFLASGPGDAPAVT